MDRLPRRPRMNPVLLIYMASARGKIVLSKLAPDAKPLNFSLLVAPLISICQVIRALKVTIARCTAKARPTKKFVSRTSQPSSSLMKIYSQQKGYTSTIDWKLLIMVN